MSNRVEKRFGQVGNAKAVLARAYDEPIAIDSDSAIPRLINSRLLIESEPGYASLSRHLRAIGDDGHERHNRFEAPETFIGLLDSLTALTRDFVAKTRAGTDNYEIEMRFRNQCAALFESVSRSLHVFQEQTENVDTQSMRLDEAERHFSFYEVQMKNYLLILNQLSDSDLVKDLDQLMAERLSDIFRRIIQSNMQDWIDRVDYLIKTIGQSLSKLRRTAQQARKLRAVVSHIQRNPNFVIQEPIGEEIGWLRTLSASTASLAIDWADEEVRARGPELIKSVRDLNKLAKRKEREVGSLKKEDDAPPKPMRPPVILQALKQWMDHDGPAGVTAMDFYRSSQLLDDIPHAMWLMTIKINMRGDKSVQWGYKPSWSHSDDLCLVDASCSTSAP